MTYKPLYYLLLDTYCSTVHTPITVLTVVYCISSHTMYSTCAKLRFVQQVLRSTYAVHNRYLVRTYHRDHPQQPS